MRIPHKIRSKTNIAIIALETTRAPDYWIQRLNEFDGVITFCDTSVNAFKSCGLNVPIFKIPHSFDMKHYAINNNYVINPKIQEAVKNKFVFYNISQLSTKKGIDILLRSYFGQFYNKKDVILILKTYINMHGRDGEREQIQSYINGVKSAMRLPLEGYPPVLLITNILTDKEVAGLHKISNCYVASSRGEGWCLPAFEALAYGNKLITTPWGGMKEYSITPNIEFTSGFMPKNNVYLVDYSLEPLIGQNHADPELFTSRDFIAEPSVKSMMTAMRNAVDFNKIDTPDLMEFDHSIVGPKMLTVINKIKEIKNDKSV